MEILAPIPGTARPRRIGALALVVALVAVVIPTMPMSPAEAQTPKFGFYLAPPFVQTPYYAAAIQDFNEALDDPTDGDAITTAQTWEGISTPLGVIGDWRRSVGNDYGGATSVAPDDPGDPQLDTNASNRTNYARAGLIDITLATPATCLGFFWTAGDVKNRVSVYTDAGQTLVATLTTEGLTAKLGTRDDPETVSAVGGAVYNTNAEYFGHPVSAGAAEGDATTRGNSSEPFAYVHAIAQGGVTFDRIVLRQGTFPDAPDAGSYGFEFDNFAVATECPVDPSLVIVDDGLLDPDFEQAFLASLQRQPVLPPVLTCSPDPVVPGGLVTCEVTGGDPDIDILWTAMIDGVAFDGRGVTLASDGTGRFTFRAPVGSIGSTIDVELVEWNAADTVAVGGPVPASVPAGEGGVPMPLALLLAGLVSLAGAVLVGRRTIVAG